MILSTVAFDLSDYDKAYFKRQRPECWNADAKEIPGEFGVWNSFAETQPDEEGDILVTCGEFAYAVLWNWDGMHSYTLDEDDYQAMTHWMRMPDPPSQLCQDHAAASPA